MNSEMSEIKKEIKVTQDTMQTEMDKIHSVLQKILKKEWKISKLI